MDVAVGHPGPRLAVAPGMNGPYVPRQFQAPCMFGCADGPVDIRPGRGAFREVTGWAPIRSGGGSNEVRLPVYTGRYAHRLCIDKAIEDAKHDPNQEKLL